MKRSEKRGIIIGLVVGILMLILSVLVSLWPACTVQGAQKTSEQGDHANSWAMKMENRGKIPGSP